MNYLQLKQFYIRLYVCNSLCNVLKLKLNYLQHSNLFQNLESATS